MLSNLPSISRQFPSIPVNLPSNSHEHPRAPSSIVNASIPSNSLRAITSRVFVCIIEHTRNAQESLVLQGQGLWTSRKTLWMDGCRRTALSPIRFDNIERSGPLVNPSIHCAALGPPRQCRQCRQCVNAPSMTVKSGPALGPLLSPPDAM